MEDKAAEAIARSVTMSERDDRHCGKSFAMFNTKALDCNHRGGHLFSLTLSALGVLRGGTRMRKNRYIRVFGAGESDACARS